MNSWFAAGAQARARGGGVHNAGAVAARPAPTQTGPPGGRQHEGAGRAGLHRNTVQYVSRGIDGLSCRT